MKHFHAEHWRSPCLTIPAIFATNGRGRKVISEAAVVAIKLGGENMPLYAAAAKAIATTLQWVSVEEETPSAFSRKRRSIYCAMTEIHPLEAIGAGRRHEGVRKEDFGPHWPVFAQSRCIESIVLCAAGAVQG